MNIEFIVCSVLCAVNIEFVNMCILIMWRGWLMCWMSELCDLDAKDECYQLCASGVEFVDM